MRFKTWVGGWDTEAEARTVIEQATPKWPTVISPGGADLSVELNAYAAFDIAIVADTMKKLVDAVADVVEIRYQEDREIADQYMGAFASTQVIDDSSAEGGEA